METIKISGLNPAVPPAVGTDLIEISREMPPLGSENYVSLRTHLSALMADALSASPLQIITSETVIPFTALRYTYLCDASLAPFSVYLPDAALFVPGVDLTLIKTDQSANFITINSVQGQLLGYPAKKYSFNATPAVAVTDVGGFTRVTISEENRIFATGDLCRISGVVGFPALNGDHFVTRPPTGSPNPSAISLDLNIPYQAGYSGGGSVEWIQTTQQLRVCGGTVIYISNGTHWVTRYATPDVWQGPKDFLFGERNVTYAGPTIPGVGVPGAAGLLDAVHNAFSHRPIFQSLALIQNADPVDMIVGIMYREAGIMSEAPATRTPIGQGVGTYYGVASTEKGQISTRLASFTIIAAEDITSAGSGGKARIGTTPVGESATLGRVEVEAPGQVWLGGQTDRGSILAEPSLLSAGNVLSGAVNAVAGDTVTIDSVVYTFRAAPALAYEVLIGATAKDSLKNLAEAVNLTGTAGVEYGTGTLIHPTVHGVAALGGNNTLNVYAKTQGAAGNAITCSEVSSYTWATPTLTGGEDANTTHLRVKGEPLGSPRVTLHSGSTISGIPNVALRLASRGNAYIHTDDPFIQNMTAAGVTTAGNVTYTVVQLVRGLLIRDCAGANRTDTLPTAAQLVTDIPALAIGDTVRCYIVNGSDAAETITIQEGVGGSWAGAQTASSRIIPQNTSKTVHMRMNSVTPGSEAYVVYL